MKVTEYLKLSRRERTKHVDLSSPCLVDESVTPKTRRVRARRALLEKLGLENDAGNWTKEKVCVCHLCACDSQNGWCTNTDHLYLGSPSENQFDLPEKVRKASSSKAGKKVVELGVGLHDPKNKEVVLEGRRKGGQKGGPQGSQVTNTRLRLCLVTGYVSSPGPLAQYQRARGVPTHLYAELDGSDLVSQTVLLGLANS